LEKEEDYKCSKIKKKKCNDEKQMVEKRENNNPSDFVETRETKIELKRNVDPSMEMKIMTRNERWERKMMTVKVKVLTSTIIPPALRKPLASSFSADENNKSSTDIHH
jgi:hypothetical protein